MIVLSVFIQSLVKHEERNEIDELSKTEEIPKQEID
jgi:hypothetical protein